MASLNNSQVRALIFNAIGRSSEVATVPFNRLVVSTGNSGYSAGALQTDFGQFPSTGLDLLNEYQKWAPVTERLTSSEYASASQVIVKRKLGDTGERLDRDVEAKLNKFLSSSDGLAWVSAQDEIVYQGKVTTIVGPITSSPQFASLSFWPASQKHITKTTT
jgi:hypothetical protein